MASYANNYTTDDALIRGSRWPPAEDYVTVIITNTSGWPVDVEDWDWYMLISRTPRGEAPDLIIDADTVVLAGAQLTLTFHATAVETLTLPHTSGKPRDFYVDIKSIDGDTNEVSFYDCVSGHAWVRNYAGEGD